MKTALFLVGAAAIGFLAGGAATLASRSAAHAAPVQPIDEEVSEEAEAEEAAPRGSTVSACSAVDGDTLRCGGERIRLVGIDSPEMSDVCAEGQSCVAGDPATAQAALAGSVNAAMPIRRFGTDREGRTLALIEGPLGDLSCSQLRSGHAIYRPDWDTDGAMRKGCAGVAEPRPSGNS